MTNYKCQIKSKVQMSKYDVLGIQSFGIHLKFEL